MPLRPTHLTALALTLMACSTVPRVADSAAATAAAATPAAAPRDGNVALAEADAAYGTAQFELAGARYEEAARLAPQDPRPPLGLARVRFAVAQTAEGLALLDRSIALAPTAEALILRGRILGVARRFDDAARDLERGLALAPGDGSPWPILTAVQVNRGDEVAARRGWEASLQALGAIAATDQLWTMLLAMAPDSQEPQESLDRCTRGHVAMFMERWAEAAHEQRNGLRNAPKFSWCIALSAETTARRGDPATAERLFRTALAGYPDRLAHLRADTQAWLARLLLARGGNAREAADLARASLAVRGERAATLELLARACAAAGETACAKETDERLLRRQDLPAPMRAAAEQRLHAPAPR
jgi:tetratricopeptide (TPR) repeat protein